MRIVNNGKIMTTFIFDHGKPVLVLDEKYINEDGSNYFFYCYFSSNIIEAFYFSKTLIPIAYLRVKNGSEIGSQIESMISQNMFNDRWLHSLCERDDTIGPACIIYSAFNSTQNEFVTLEHPKYIWYVHGVAFKSHELEPYIELLNLPHDPLEWSDSDIFTLRMIMKKDGSSDKHYKD